MENKTRIFFSDLTYEKQEDLIKEVSDYLLSDENIRKEIRDKITEQVKEDEEVIDVDTFKSRFNDLLEDKARKTVLDTFYCEVTTELPIY